MTEEQAELTEQQLEAEAAIENPDSPEGTEADTGETPEQRINREKRRFTRFRIQLSVNIRLSNGDIARAQAVDLSIGGIYLEYGASADIGRVFEMCFDLPFEKQFKRVIVKAEVVRCIVIGRKDVFGIAFNFVEYARQSEQVLIEYIDRRSKKTAM